MRYPCYKYDDFVFCLFEIESIVRYSVFLFRSLLGKNLRLERDEVCWIGLGLLVETNYKDITASQLRLKRFGMVK